MAKSAAVTIDIPDGEVSEAEELAAVVAAEVKKPDSDEKPEKAAKEPDKAEKKAKPEQEGPVPELIEERKRRQAAEREFNKFKKEADERNARLDERLRMLQDAMTPRQAVRAPDPRTDPAGAFQNLAQRLDKTEGELAEERRQRDETQRQQAAEEEMWGSYRKSGREYSKEVPDFPDAYNYLRQSRINELESMGFDPQTINQTLLQDEYSLAINAQQTGTDPADTIYRWAKARGYAGKAAPAANGKPTGAAADLTRMKDAQEASETLSKSGGTPGKSGRITLEDIDALDPDEYSAFIRKVNAKDPEAFDRLLARLEGGRR